MCSRLMGRNYRQLSNLYEYQNGRVAQVTMRKHILKRVDCVCVIANMWKFN